MSQKPKTRICVLVSGGGTNLQALIDAEKRGELPNGVLSLVVSNRKNAFAMERAKAAGIAVRWIGKQDFENSLQQVLQEEKIDLIILAGFLRILTKSFTEKWPRRILNIHPSLIPSFCGEGFYGLKVHEAALERGVKLTGATVHYVNEIPDGGEIILQKAVEIHPDDTPEVLQRRVMEEAEWKLLPQAAEIAAKEIRNDRFA